MAAVLFFLLHHEMIAYRVNPKWLDRASLGPLRLINLASVFYLACRFRTQIYPCVAWRGFALLSRHSLQVFAYHLIPVYLVALLFEERLLHRATPLPLEIQAAFIVLCVASLFLIAGLAKLIKEAGLRIRSKPRVSSVLAAQ
jgi:hypothetical protein